MQLIEYNQILTEIKKYNFIVIDAAITKHYPTLSEQLVDKSVYIVENAEQNKDLNCFEAITSYFITEGITRQDGILAVGGGATSDIAGFVAASILRGVMWSVVPTTLLSMIDASIGGKVGLNTIQGKNLIGAFHRPKDILICDSFLNTLPDIEFDAGKGELLKYVFLSEDIQNELVENGFSKKLISLCADFKLEITAEDYKELGNRKILNLGHTFGHAFEKALDYPHGIAVYHGLKMIISIFRPELVDLFNRVEVKLDFTKIPFEKCDFTEFSKYLKHDKKRLLGDEIELIIPSNKFKPDIITLNMDELLTKIKSHDSYKNYFR